MLVKVIYLYTKTFSCYPNQFMSLAMRRVNVCYAGVKQCTVLYLMDIYYDAELYGAISCTL